MSITKSWGPKCIRHYTDLHSVCQNEGSNLAVHVVEVPIHTATVHGSRPCTLLISEFESQPVLHHVDPCKYESIVDSDEETDAHAVRGCVCVCVCVRVRMYVCMYVLTYVRTYMFMLAWRYKCVCA